MKKRKKPNPVLLSVFLLLLTTCLSSSVFALNTTAARNYSNTYALDYNDYFDPKAKDCANFVSQILYAGGMQKDSIWSFTKPGSGAPMVYTPTWVGADRLKNYLSNNKGARKLSSGWSKNGTPEPYKTYAYIDNSANINGTADEVIFYDWVAEGGTMDHTSHCVSTGYGADYSSYGDLINQHISDRYKTLWHLDRYNSDRLTTKIYAFRVP